MGSLEKRYAEALLSLAENADQADAIGSALGILGRLYHKNSEFRNFILNPVISQQIRSETLIGVLEMLGFIKSSNDESGEDAVAQAISSKRKKPGAVTAKVGKSIKAIKAEEADVFTDDMASAVLDAGVMLLRFLQLLLEKGRFAFLPDIADEYNNIKAKHRNSIQIIVRSAAPLDSKELSELCEKYQMKYGALNAEIENIVEPSKMSETSIQIGDIRVDDTIYGRLAALSRAVAGGADKQALEARI